MNGTVLEQHEAQTGVSSGDEDARQYLREIRRYPMLTQQQERELAMECARGNEEALRQMVNANLRLVVSIARKYAGRGVPLLDLIQEGSIGLIAAARQFDCTRETRFSTYASKSIRRQMIRYLTQHGEVIRLTGYTAERLGKLRSEMVALQGELGREPTEEELAQRLELPEEKVAQLRLLDPELCSLDAPVGEDQDASLGGCLPGDEALEPQAVVIREELSSILNALMEQLDPRQRTILRLHYGMEDGQCYALEKIGQKLGISKERVRQIEQKAIKRLNNLGIPLGLEDFLG